MKSNIGVGRVEPTPGPSEEGIRNATLSRNATPAAKRPFPAMRPFVLGLSHFCQFIQCLPSP